MIYLFKESAIRSLLFILLIQFIAPNAFGQRSGREYYQLTVYHYKEEGQEKVIDEYLEKAFIPAMHRLKISPVGVFKARENDTASARKIVVLLPLKSLEMVASLTDILPADKIHLEKGDAYIESSYQSPPFSRMETILLRSFELAPPIQVPRLTGNKKERVYELRSYEGPTEKLYRKKVQMFNKGDEIGLFKRLNFNAVFYGEVLAGCHMPNLMYMTCFENMDDRNLHWKAFVEDNQWKTISAMPEYQHTVSRNEITFLYPADYSEL